MTEKQQRARSLNYCKFRVAGMLCILQSLVAWFEKYEGGGGGRYHEQYSELRNLTVELDNFRLRLREEIK